jgi:DNA replication protein DnaC
MTILQNLDRTNTAVLHKQYRTQNVPKRYWEAELQPAHMDFVGADTVCDGSIGLYLIGESGVGKSWLSVAWLRYLIFKGMRCQYINWADVMVKLRIDIKYYEQLLASVQRADCVFIDDFDATNTYMYDVVYNFINTLYNAPKLVHFNSVDLPTQAKLAMRIGEMTTQVKLVRGN